MSNTQEKTRIELPGELGRELAAEVDKMVDKAMQKAAAFAATAEPSSKYPYFMGYISAALKDLAQELADGSVLIR